MTCGDIRHEGTASLPPVQDRESWRARLRQSRGVRQRPVSELDGWRSLDDPAGYNEMCRWPVILDDGVTAPRAKIRIAEIA